MKKSWLQMGAELEGSWVLSRVKVAAGVRGASAHKDLSVHIGHGDPGEIVTRPHAELLDLIADVLKLWPDTVNDSCGFHIHTSFTPMAGSMVASREFYGYFKERWASWGKRMNLGRTHEFWARLAGKVKFCVDRFEPEKQFKAWTGKPEDRYTMLNFFAWEKHGTIECRLLPMFSDKALAQEALVELGDIYDTFLGTNEFRPVVIESATDIIGEEARELYESVLPETTPREFTAVGTFPQLRAGEDVFYSILGATDQMLPFTFDTGKSTP